MDKENLYMLCCLYAINQLIKQGSMKIDVKLNGQFKTIYWDEVKAWIEKEYAVESEVTNE